MNNGGSRRLYNFNDLSRASREFNEWNVENNNNTNCFNFSVAMYVSVNVHIF